MLVKHGPIAITTTSGGAATVYSGEINGRLVGFLYDKGTLDNGTDLTITSETTGQALLTVTNAGAADLFLYPRTPVANGSNAAITNSFDFFRLASERIKIVVAQGGNITSGDVYALAEEDATGDRSMIIKHASVAFTTDGSGDATVYTKGEIRGKIIAVLYTQGGIDNGATVTLTGTTTATPIVAFAGNATSPIYPRTPVVNASNAAITNSHDHVRLYNETVKIVVASGGATASGSLILVTEE